MYIIIIDACIATDGLNVNKEDYNVENMSLV